MVRFLLNRLATMVAATLLLTAALFFIMPFAALDDPAVVAAGGVEATPAQIAEARIRLELDLPVHLRYWNWLTRAMRGELGTSLFTSQSVASILVAAIPVTLAITIVAALFAVVFGIPAGALAAWMPSSGLAKAISLMSAIGIATPHFVVGLVLLRAFSIQAGWFPAIGFPSLAVSDVAAHPGRWLSYAILPGIALAVPMAAALASYMRAALSEVLTEDYVRTAVGKGLPPAMVLVKHSLRNALIPVVTIFGLELRQLLGGSVAVESVFALSGIGTIAVKAVVQGDYPVILGVALLSLVVVTLINLVVDMSYAFLNPKLRIA